ncbi:hypothetical protein [Cupriavidus sp. DL-D2]|uniref:hypothetical protein n=1 Tax=Cupriavidus sp. DL-D2 TaxID=3144974 RepID=UPI003212C0EF
MASVQRAAWPFAAPAARPAIASSNVRERLLRQPRGSSVTEIEFRGRDRDAVQKAAQQRAGGIDAYRSPAVQTTRLDGDDWVCVLKYYGV